MTTQSDTVFENSSGWDGSQTWAATQWPGTRTLDVVGASSSETTSNTEAAAASDAVVAVLASASAGADAASAADTFSGTLAQVSAIAEGASAADAENSLPIYGGRMSESGAASDTPFAVQIANVAGKDDGNASDAPSGTAVGYAAASDFVVPADFSSGVSSATASGSESAQAGDASVNFGTLRGHAADAGAAGALMSAAQAGAAAAGESADLEADVSADVLKSVYNVEFKKTAQQRMLDYPHAAVFDKDPDQVLAFLLHHRDRAQWTVADRVMTAWGGSVKHAYDLNALTVAQLVDALRADGFEVTRVNSSVYPLSAAVLIEDRGDEWLSFGNQVFAFTSELWALMSVYTDDVSLDGSQRVKDALAQMLIPTAEGFWLDLWGALFGVSRATGEGDAALRQDIPAEAFRLRCNALAIEKAIFDELGLRVKIREPWKEMFRLDQSALSGVEALHDATYYSPFYIQPVSSTSVDWAAVLKVVERNRAAGVFVYDPVMEMAPIVVDAGMRSHTRIGVAITSDFTGFARALGEVPLGEMILDDNHFTFNNEIKAYQLQSFANANRMQPYDELLPYISIPYASVTLSDGVPLGDENAALGLWQELTEFHPDPVMSDGLSLSDYTAEDHITRIERVEVHDHAYGNVTSSITPTASEQRSGVFSLGRLFYGEMPTKWVGTWSMRPWMGRASASFKRTDISV